MLNTNKELRQKMKQAGLKQWQLAELLGIREDAFSKLMRYELTEEYRQKCFAAIDELRKGVTA